MAAAVFFKTKDLTNPRAVTDFDVCKSVANVIGGENLVGCQRIGGLYRIYPKDNDNRAKLLAEKISLKGQSVHVYSDNPFRAGIEGPDHKVVKITVKDLPDSKANDSLKQFLEEKGLKLTSEIQYGKVRDTETKKLTDWRNGDRYVYVEAFETPLQRIATVGSSRVRIYHEGQEAPKSDIICTKCYGRDHSRSKCPKPEIWCRLCQCEGHKAGGEGCTSVTAQPQDGVTTIFGSGDPLSNHYPCDISVMGQSYASAEHAYLHTKALNTSRSDIAEKIKNATTAAEAKRISKEIPFNPNWSTRRDQVMEAILRAKMNQVPIFAETLLATDRDVLVGAAAGDFHWGSGLSSMHSKVTKKEKWPGRNTLGKIQTRLREEIKKSKKSRKDKNQASSTKVHNTRSVSQTPCTNGRYSQLEHQSPGCSEDEAEDFGGGM